MAKNNKQTNLGIFGLGNMGQAIFKLLRKSRTGKKLNFNICSIGLKKINGAILLDSLDQLIKPSDIIFLCLKPQDFYKLKPAAPNHKIFISIMAGVNIKKIKKIVGSPKVIRVMPNLPLQVGHGVIAWYAGAAKLAQSQFSLIKKLFSSFGYNFKVKTEADLDKITALSGSGPAYVFLFMDALMQSAVTLGFSKEQAETMIFELLTGSLKYYQSVKKLYTPGQLINLVKSKKGTTEAALNKLNIKKFNQQWHLAISAAYKRAKEISNYGHK